MFPTFLYDEVRTLPDDSLDANSTRIGEWEKFSVINNDDDTVSFHSAHQMYLVAEPDGGMNANRGEIGPWEKFWLETQTNIKKLANLSSHLCLDTDGSAVDGGTVRMWGCMDHPNQDWTIERVDAFFFRLINDSSNLCLDTDGSAWNGAQVRMWQCLNLKRAVDRHLSITDLATIRDRRIATSAHGVSAISLAPINSTRRSCALV